MKRNHSNTSKGNKNEKYQEEKVDEEEKLEEEKLDEEKEEDENNNKKRKSTCQEVSESLEQQFERHVKNMYPSSSSSSSSSSAAASSSVENTPTKIVETVYMEVSMIYFDADELLTAKHGNKRIVAAVMLRNAGNIEEILNREKEVNGKLIFILLKIIKLIILIYI
jgi:hypothetical protein